MIKAKTILFISLVLLFVGCSNNGIISCKDFLCMGENFKECVPSELKMDSDAMKVVITVYGFEDDKCHYAMVFNDVVAADCYFNKEDLNDKTLNQMLGTEEGQDKVIQNACG
ncbi:MAG: hypothetical protein PHT54_04055 [Candidatus Nanoarchaeia archaeon]|nr:hypothetical protein [Candidatus Nanoarchaeia archaeon]